MGRAMEKCNSCVKGCKSTFNTVFRYWTPSRLFRLGLRDSPITVADAKQKRVILYMLYGSVTRVKNSGKLFMLVKFHRPTLSFVPDCLCWGME